MKLLAIDTASKLSSIALFDEGHLLFECKFNHGNRLSGAILDSIHFGLKQLNWKLRDIDCFGCDLGPGPFTSIKIGVEVVKTLAHTMNKPTIGISSLEIVNSVIKIPVGSILAIGLPSKKDEYYTQIFNSESALTQPAAQTADEFIGEIEKQTYNQIFNAGSQWWVESSSSTDWAMRSKMIHLPITFPDAIMLGDACQHYINDGMLNCSFELQPIYVIPPSISVSKKKILAD